jgi:hypothetical protein
MLLHPWLYSKPPSPKEVLLEWIRNPPVNESDGWSSVREVMGLLANLWWLRSFEGKNIRRLQLPLSSYLPKPLEATSNDWDDIYHIYVLVCVSPKCPSFYLRQSQRVIVIISHWMAKGWLGRRKPKGDWSWSVYLDLVLPDRLVPISILDFKSSKPHNSAPPTAQRIGLIFM